MKRRSGSVSVMGAIVTGLPAAKARPLGAGSSRGHPVESPPMSLGISPFLDEEQRAFAETIKRFAREQLDDPELVARDAKGEFWTEGWRRCGTIGLCGLP